MASYRVIQYVVEGAETSFAVPVLSFISEHFIAAIIDLRFIITFINIFLFFVLIFIVNCHIFMFKRTETKWQNFQPSQTGILCDLVTSPVSVVLPA